MKTKKINVAIICGGTSAEHEVSLRSARTVAAAIDKTKYNVILIGIHKDKTWYLDTDQSVFFLNPEDPTRIAINTKQSKKVTLTPAHNTILSLEKEIASHGTIDVVFPILHGPFGEDGTIQGFLKLAGIPFVGASVLGSAVGMDKDVMKRLLRDAGIPIGAFITLHDYETLSFKAARSKLGLPFFVKPANMGSSVGISKVTRQSEYLPALREAFLFDHKVLLEQAISGREIECSVLGNENPVASVAGEIIVHSDFYSYKAKYIDENGATLSIPARIPKSIEKNVQRLAIAVFKTLSCEGFGRVDFFLKENGELLVNEINTIPGFTSISMYPKLWEASGISYAQLIDKLIQLALERFKKEQKLKLVK